MTTAENKIESILNENEKIQLLKDKVSKLTEELTNEIYEITNSLPYKEGSLFSYNIDRLNQFNNELQKF